jgi:hypothetical protein
MISSYHFIIRGKIAASHPATAEQRLQWEVTTYRAPA